MVMIVMTTRISTSVKPPSPRLRRPGLFVRLIASPDLRLIPVRPERRLLVLHAVGRGWGPRVPREVTARAPHVEAADVDVGRAAGSCRARRGPAGARLPRDIVAV